ncbi:60S ribosomal protein L24 [Sesamum angolense]|uniref:60S ribosomal protein L24 n=1 Tax=Sesamum angolense TaxID=2727404 RepID=A0AAE1WX40_9LAMI|nr:60S ribosomal protein L24 [Sesamum angolense]
MESQLEDASLPSVRESNNVTESNIVIEMSKDIPDKVEIEETSEDNSKRKRTSEAWNHFKRVKVEGDESKYIDSRYVFKHVGKYDKYWEKMARDILAIPVSTTASESAFSSSGKLINPHRNRLHHYCGGIDVFLSLVVERSEWLLGLWRRNSWALLQGSIGRSITEIWAQRALSPTSMRRRGMTELCRFSGAKIYPGKGIRFIRSDSQVFLFANSKCKRYFHNRLRPAKLTWTAMYRKQHKKDIAAEAVKKRRRTTKKPYSRSIVGATLEVIQKRRAEKPEVRDAAREAALREIKERIKKTKDEKKAKKAEVMSKQKGSAKSSVPRVLHLRVLRLEVVVESVKSFADLE